MTPDDLTDGKRACLHCDKPTPEPYLNYCDWTCHVDAAKAAGGKIITPNGLPIRCIKADCTMMEHEEADHPDYKFPVKVEYIGDITIGDREDAKHIYGVDDIDDTAKVRDSMSESHALIYTDGSVVVTLYECCYAFFYLRKGEGAGGSFHKPKEWKLADESIEKIKSYLAKRVEQ